MFAMIMLGLACLLYTAMNWQLRKFGEVTYEQILFHINVPLASESGLVASFLQNTVLVAALLLVLVYVLLAARWNRPKWLAAIQKIILRYKNILAAVLLLASLFYVLVKLNISEIIDDYKASSEVSDFYEKHYVDGNNVRIIKPKQKRNLVLIFVESAEATLLRQEYRRLQPDMMPELYKLAKENLNFSADDDIGGSIQVDGTQWTQAGLVAQTCGIPLHLPIANHNKFLPKYGYLPKVKCLTDILREQGYNQTFLTGMEKSYAGVDRFFRSHGKPRILSWETWKRKYNLRDQHDKIRRRVLRDEGLYIEAKNEISRLAQDKNPFAVILMTLDTHFGEEYLDEQNCHANSDQRHVNVYNCASKKLGDFVVWLKQQPFYKNTTVVVVSDHLVMNGNIFAKNTERWNLNIFINPVIQKKVNRKRNFMPFDIYPTIVESMGFEIEGGRLGLGASLLGKKATLPDKGIDNDDKFDAETSKRSLIYDELLYGKSL